MPDLWSGRLPTGPAPDARRFTGTVEGDWRLAPYDILGSQAHVAMLHAVGLLSEAEAAALSEGLARLAEEVAGGAPPWDPAAEDVHTAVEQELARRVGPVAGKLHTGRSRNDQVALDLHLFVQDACRSLAARLDTLLTATADLAEAHADLPAPGYTHLQRAQPVTVGHHLLAYGAMWARDRERVAAVYRAAGRSPLGAGALAGSTLPLDPARTAALLGLAGPYDNSLDAVSDRDFAVELVFAVALLLTHLSRFAEDVVLWSTQEFGFIEIDDAWATGSSMMPQKKNPDVAELLRGRAARGVAALSGLLTVLKGLPLAYNRDLQEDKPYVFWAYDTALACLDAAAGLLRHMHFRPERLRAALTVDLLATDAADRLVEQGVPFREAHAQVAGSRSWEQPEAASDAAVQASLARRDRPMGPGPDSVRRQIATLRDIVGRPL